MSEASPIEPASGCALMPRSIRPAPCRSSALADVRAARREPRRSCVRQTGRANLQRGAKRQPAICSAMSGAWPSIASSATVSPITGIAPKQRPRIGMLRRGRRRRRPALLDDLARIHDDDALAEMADDEQVMRDRAGSAKPVSCLQLAEQLEIVRLRRGVERRGRLVGDQQARARRQARWRWSTRWRMPPLSWCGYCRAARRPPADEPARATSTSGLVERRRRAGSDAGAATAASWLRIVKDGSSAVIASCRTIAICLPRMRCSSRWRLS